MVRENNDKAERSRIQLDLSPQMDEVLSALVTLTGMATRSEVLRRAISLYAALVRESGAGNSIEVVSPDKSRKEVLIY